MANYDKSPLAIESKGNGSYFYRWDIDKVQIEDRTLYNCKEVTIWLPLTKEKIKRAVIDALWGKNYEQKLINEYNSVKLGLLDDDLAEGRYKDFLQQRIAIKEQVDKDCEEFNIK